jgi:hypothetical protein
MTWFDPDQDPWERDLPTLPLTLRARRVLALQGLSTVHALSDAVHRGEIDIYPSWLQDEVQQMFEALRASLSAATDRRSVAGQERRARITSLDWTTTVVGRWMSDDETMRLARTEVDSLCCLPGIKGGLIRLGALDALDAALVERRLFLQVAGLGPARLESLRVAIDRALHGDVLPVSRPAPWHADAKYRVAGRPLSRSEIAVLQRRATSELALPARAARTVVAAGLETWLDLAAATDSELLTIRGCGRLSIRHVRTIFRERLATLATSGASRDW